MDPLISAAISVIGGILVGGLAAWTSRQVIRRRSREHAGTTARTTATFLFWFFVFVGIVVGIGVLTPATLETVPTQVLGFLPRVLAAGLIAIGTWAAAAAAGRLVRRGLASTVGEPGGSSETAVRAVVLATGLVFAVAQLGIDTTILTILVAVVGLALGLGFALLVGFGGREIAAEVAAGRYLSRHLSEGDRLVWAGGDVVIRGLHPASIELTDESGARLFLPYSRLFDDGLTMPPD